MQYPKRFINTFAPINGQVGAKITTPKFKIGQKVYSSYHRHLDAVPLLILDQIFVSSGWKVLAEAMRPQCECCGAVYPIYYYIGENCFSTTPGVPPSVYKDPGIDLTRGVLKQYFRYTKRPKPAKEQDKPDGRGGNL